MKNPLPPGIYEQVISNGLAQLLDALPAGRKDEGSIDAAEAPAILTDYLAAFLQQALTEIGEGSDPFQQRHCIFIQIFPCLVADKE